MNLMIMSKDPEPFADRRDSGIKLGYALSRRLKMRPLVLGIPRGGVVIAKAVADLLGCDMDIVLARKIGAPFNPELALGAINEDGQMFRNDLLLSQLGIDSQYLEHERAQQMRELSRRRQLFRSVYPKAPLQGRCVIVVDDGIATGATAQAALQAVRQEQPARLIGAFPVACIEALKHLDHNADDIVCLKVPEYFYSVGEFYQHFPQISDEEVLDILKAHRHAARASDRSLVHY